MKHWIGRLTLLEQKASSLFIDEKLDKWIKENIIDAKLDYSDIMNRVPNKLKLPCVFRWLEQLRPSIPPNTSKTTSTPHPSNQPK